MEKRFGSQTPTVGFTLPYTITKGSEAVELYEQTGRTCLEWQKTILYDLLAVDDDGIWIHSRYGYSVPRQNGKNEVIAIREMYGLVNGEIILHTAHRTSTSGAAWSRLCKLLEAAGIKEKKGEVKEGYRSGKSKGQEFIELDETLGGGRINFRTRTTTGGLGETYDLLIYDEAQEVQDDQEDTLKYTISSRPNPQTIWLGTPPTPQSSGTLFPKFRKDILCGSKSHAGWAEWSVEEKTDPHDVESWYQTNPSLGYTLKERTIEEEIGEDTDDFNIQRLGLWIRYNQHSAISKKEWQAMEVQQLPALTGLMCFGVKFAKDGASSSLSVALKTNDGNTFVECIGCRSMRDGVAWIADYLKACGKNYSSVIVDGSNGADLLTQAMKDRGLKAPTLPTVKEVIDANALFEQCIFNKELVHMNQPSVEQIISNCEKRAIGSGGGFGFKSTNIAYDISIMDSIIYAVWGCANAKPKRAPRVSY